MLRLFVSISLLVFSLSSCTIATIIGTATATTIAGVANMQERSFGTIVDDTIIKAKIKNKFRKSNFKNLFLNISVKSVDGAVVLMGSTNDPQFKIDAVKIAWSVDGVNAVADEIQLTSKNDSYVKDSAITVSIKSKIMLSKKIRSFNYTVETVNGVVYVMGTARHKEEIDHVVDIASRIAGVKKVINYAFIQEKYKKSGKWN